MIKQLLECGAVIVLTLVFKREALFTCNPHSPTPHPPTSHLWAYYHSDALSRCFVFVVTHVGHPLAKCSTGQRECASMQTRLQLTATLGTLTSSDIFLTGRLQSL